MEVIGAYHFAVNGIYSWTLFLGRECQDRLGFRFRGLYPTRWLLKDIGHVGRYRIVIFDHLLQCEEIQ